MAEALYTKYRPQVFEDVVGQEHIERTIKNAIEQDKVSHAYLFCGPRGTGKTTTARLLAKALLCQNGPTAEPDGTCEDCKLIAAGEHPDVYELDAASRTGVDNVREEIIGRVQFAPTRGRYKVYIIDEVHMLSVAAFNALLKTLEEPPSHVVFILATTDPQKVPETIHSRCQRFDFRRISTEAMVARLGAVCVSEGVEFEGEALDLIAHRAEGGLRNALTSLEQIIAFGEGKVTLAGAESMLGSLDSSELSEIMAAIGARDAAACFRWVAQYVETGADLARFTRDLAEHVRNLYVMSLAGADLALEVSATERRELEAELPRFGSDRLARLLGILGDVSAELKTSTNPRLSFEIALTRMVRPDSDLTLESLAERVEALESGYSACAQVVGGAAGAGAPAMAMASAAQTQPQAQARAGVEPQMRAQAEPQAQPRTQSQPQEAAYSQVEPVRRASEQPSANAGSQQHEAPRTVQPAAASAAQQPAQASDAQAAAAQPAPEAASTGALSGELAATLRNEAALQRIWSAAIASLKKAKAAYGVLFLNTKAVFDEARGALIIEFSKDNNFAFKAVQKPDVADAVSAALAAACGSALPFSFSQGPAAVAPTGARTSAGVAASHAGSATQQPSAARQAAAAALERVRQREQTQGGAMRQMPQEGASRMAQQGAQPAQPRARQEARPASQQASSQAQQATRASFGGGAVPEPDPVPLDAYGSAPYDEPVPYGDADVPFDEAPQAAPASRASSPAPDEHASAFPAGAPASDARTSASVQPTDASGKMLDGTFSSSEDLAALLDATGFAGSRIEEMRE